MSTPWGPTKIPRVNSTRIIDLRFEPDWNSAYGRLVDIERRYSKMLADTPEARDTTEALDTTEARATLQTHIMHLRVIGWLYVFAVRLQCRHELSLRIVSCPDDETVIDLGRFLCDQYLRAFRKAKDRIPSDSSHPSRNSFDRRRETIEKKLIPAPINYSDAKRYACERDNDQCVFTKQFSRLSPLYDDHTPDSNRQAILRSARALPRSTKLEDLSGTPETTPFCKLECAHIFSESINQNIATDANYYKKFCQLTFYLLYYTMQAWATSVLDILESFGHSHLRQELQGALIHRLENVISISSEYLDMFDSLDLWLEHVVRAAEDGEEGHRYLVRAPNRRQAMVLVKVYSDDGIIEFTTPNERLYPLPSREYIQLHAAACKVAHMSGAADHFSKIDRALDEDGVLAEDGHQMFVLADRLRQAIAAH
ncbi:hypothetical protein BD626DRAFT_457594 [Schizophyllum amplum]|uniref:HNH nuclease domain-containing protein n=1 Tax=Schizophyllum amplum TaxID=97359 RepID=A0A550CET9_9AGAR|nr:hypothetical protein BD626DRAFT_457594 [Auriculariopsis ampla]